MTRTRHMTRPQYSEPARACSWPRFTGPTVLKMPKINSLSSENFRTLAECEQFEFREVRFTHRRERDDRRHGCISRSILPERSGTNTKVPRTRRLFFLMITDRMGSNEPWPPASYDLTSAGYAFSSMRPRSLLRSIR